MASFSAICGSGDGGPLTASAVARGIDRSAGAVANCLARLTKAKVRQTKSCKADELVLASEM